MKNFILLITLFICACTTPTPINVSVESAVNEDIDVDQYNKCHILNEDKNLFKKNFENILRADLSEYGIHFEKDPKNANCVILFNATISEPDVRTEVNTVPVFGETSVNTINTHYYGSSSVSKVNYNYGVTGYAPVFRTTTTYHRNLNIIAATTKITPLWQISVKSSGNSGNLESIFPFLSLAAASFAKRKYNDTLSFPNDLFSYSYFENDGKFYRFDDECYEIYDKDSLLIPFTTHWKSFACVSSAKEEKKEAIKKMKKIPLSKIIRHAKAL